jgi:hypothetical protein
MLRQVLEAGRSLRQDHGHVLVVPFIRSRALVFIMCLALCYDCLANVMFPDIDNFVCGGLKAAHGSFCGLLTKECA